MDARITEEILRQVAACPAGRSVCPTDVARALAPEWHALLGSVRREAIVLALAGRIEILRKGKPVPAAGVKGVIRLRAVPAC